MKKKYYCNKELNNRYIYIPNLCPKCKKDNFNKKEKKIDIIKSFYISCKNKK